MPAVLGGPGGVRSLANVVCQEVRGVVSSAPLWVPAGPCPLTLGVSSGERLTPSLSSLPIHWAHWTTDLKGSLMLLCSGWRVPAPGPWGVVQSWDFWPGAS